MNEAIAALSLVVVAASAFAMGWFLCSRSQANRLDAAEKIATIGERAGQTYLASAHAESSRSASLDRLAAAVEAQAAGIARNAESLEGVRHVQSGMLNVLANAGLVRHVDLDNMRQVGQPAAGARKPTSLETAELGGQKPLEGILKPN